MVAVDIRNSPFLCSPCGSLKFFINQWGCGIDRKWPMIDLETGRAIGHSFYGRKTSKKQVSKHHNGLHLKHFSSQHIFSEVSIWPPTLIGQKTASAHAWLPIPCSYWSIQSQAALWLVGVLRMGGARTTTWLRWQVGLVPGWVLWRRVARALQQCNCGAARAVLVPLRSHPEHV